MATGPDTPSQPDPSPPRVLQGLMLAQTAIALVGWFWLLAGRPDPSVWQRDWYNLWETGHRFLGGEVSGLYTTDIANASGYFWLYPPYALYPAALLGALPAPVAYGALMLGIAGTVAGCVVALKRLLPSADHATVMAYAFGGPGFVGTLITGQNAAWWLAGMVGCLLALERGRPIVAGLCIAVLGFKPHWMLYFLGWIVLTGRWRMLAATAAVGAAMLLSTVPLDPVVWVEFVESTRGMGAHVATFYEGSKLITVHATLRSLLGHGSAVLTPLWLCFEVSMLLAWLAVLRYSRSAARQVGVTALFLIASNVYIVFYDALVLLIPMAVWWTRPEPYGLAVHRWIGVGIVAAFGLGWLNLFAYDGDLSLVGAALWVWMVGEGWAVWEAREAIGAGAIEGG